MSELNWPGLMVSEEYGGQELGTVELAVLMEQLGYALAPGPFLSTHPRRARARGGRAPTSSASATWRRSRPASSAERSRSGMPGAGWTPDRHHARARRRRTADTCCNGEKLFVLDAATADFFIVGATGGRRFIVERDADGVSDHADADDRRRPASSTRSSSTA